MSGLLGWIREGQVETPGPSGYQPMIGDLVEIGDTRFRVHSVVSDSYVWVRPADSGCFGAGRQLLAEVKVLKWLP